LRKGGRWRWFDGKDKVRIMKITYLLALAGASILATTAQCQTGGGAATGGGGAASGGAAAGGGAAGATVNGSAATSQGQGVQVNPNAGALQQNVPRREPLPPALQNRQQQLRGGTNALGGQLPPTNFFGGGSNGFGFSNRFGFSNGFGFSNRFGFTNRFGTNFGGTNRFRRTNDNDFDDTNGFHSRSNRFRGTNGFGRTNRFGTNGFGFGTNGVTNELSISNSIVLSNAFGLNSNSFIPSGDGGAFAAGGTGATPAPAAAPGPGNPPPEAPLPPTGAPGANRIFGSTTNRAAGVALQDRSVTESDRNLLQNIRKLVIPRLEAMGAWGPAVHFWVGDGNVTMVGTVQSKETRAEAEAMVSQLSGVASVKDNLFVGNIDPNASETDQELLYRVREAVLPQVATGSASSPVDFSVRDGVVTVVGRASSPEEATRLQKMVQQVPGVDHVKSELLVSNSGSVLAAPDLFNSTEAASTNLPATGRQSGAEQQQPEPQAQSHSQSASPAPQQQPDDSAASKTPGTPPQK
jgi:hypothetical protein